MQHGSEKVCKLYTRTHTHTHTHTHTLSLLENKRLLIYLADFCGVEVGVNDMLRTSTSDNSSSLLARDSGEHAITAGPRETYRKCACAKLFSSHVCIPTVQQQSSPAVQSRVQSPGFTPFPTARLSHVGKLMTSYVQT